MRKIFLSISACIFIFAVLTNVYNSSEVDPITTNSITPSYEGVLSTVNGGGVWIVSAQTMADFDRAVSLKFPVSFEF